MSKSGSSPSVADLFKSAQETGLSVAAVQALDIPDLGAQIQQGLGIHPDDVPAQEVTLVSQLIDDSGSIRFGGNSQEVRDGHNLVLESLKGSKQASGVLMYTRYLNGYVLYPFSQLDSVPLMDTHNYNPDGGTPLYDQTAVILGTVLAKFQQFEDAGTPARTVTVIVTDGMDQGSYNQSVSSVRTVVREMLAKERHIIAGIGIQYQEPGGRPFDFRAIFREMGLEDKWILTPKDSKSDIRKAFAMVSQSAVRASQGGASFSKTAIGGFGATP